MLGTALPILMALNHEPFDVPIVTVFIVFAVLGLWWSAYAVKYRVVIGSDGFVVHRLARAPLSIAWRDVVAVKQTQKEIAFATSDRRQIGISTLFNGYDALRDAAGRYLPEAVFGPGERPEVIDPPMTPEEQRLAFILEAGMWLATARVTVLCGVSLFALGFFAKLGLRHIDWRAIPERLATAGSYAMAYVKVFAFIFGSVLVGLAILYVIMAIQARGKARRI